jgi:hypothetical protein
MSEYNYVNMYIIRLCSKLLKIESINASYYKLCPLDKILAAFSLPMTNNEDVLNTYPPSIPV